jgi:hypothetical protein
MDDSDLSVPRRASTGSVGAQQAPPVLKVLRSASGPPAGSLALLAEQQALDRRRLSLPNRPAPPRGPPPLAFLDGPGKRAGLVPLLQPGQKPPPPPRPPPLTAATTTAATAATTAGAAAGSAVLVPVSGSENAQRYAVCMHCCRTVSCHVVCCKRCKSV